MAQYGQQPDRPSVSGSPGRAVPERQVMRAGRGAGIAILLLLLAMPQAWARGFKYDPHSCKKDAHGKLFIALGRNVLAVRYAGVVMLGDLTPGHKPLPVPDPTAPIGCPGNPKQLESYAFLYKYQASHDVKFGIKPASNIGVNLLQLIHLLPIGADPGMKWGGEESELMIARDTCARATLREELSNGFKACRVKPEHPANALIADWGASYVARPSVYKTPLGHPFVVNCGPLLFSDRIGYCDVTYAMRPGLGVTYRFHPFGRLLHLPIDDAISFDRGLRHTIMSALITGYSWPNASASQKPKESDSP